MEHKKGNIYIASNPAFRHLLKLGITKKEDPDDRVCGLNSTGVPDYFHILYYEPSKSCVLAEDICQLILNDYRYNEKREFFEDIDARTLNKIMQKSIEIADMIVDLDIKKETTLKPIQEKELKKQQPVETELTDNDKTKDINIFYFNTNKEYHPSRFDELKDYGYMSVWNNVGGYNRLKIGDIFAAYLSGKGYVAVGKIVEEAKMIESILKDNEKLKLVSIEKPRDPEDLRHDAKRDGVKEYLYRVEWIKIVDEKDAVRGHGYRQTICKIKDTKTINILKEMFNL